MQLTKTEYSFADRYVTKLEKRARQWAWGRWGILTFSLLWIALGLLELRLWLSHVDEIAISAPVERAKAVDAPVTYYEMKSELARAQLESLRYLFSLISLGGGWAFLVYTLTRWNRHKLNRLLARFFREKLGETVAVNAEGTPDSPSKTEPPGCLGV